VIIPGQSYGRGVGWDFIHVCLDDYSRVASAVVEGAAVVAQIHSLLGPSVATA
jgi:hypothetical protein